MESNEKKLVLESLKEISVYNKDFALLLYEYLKQSLNTNINLNILYDSIILDIIKKLYFYM